MRRVAFITGGEGDLARAIHTELEKADWQVIAPGKNECDVTNIDSITKTLRALPRLDYLIHTAGVLRDGALTRMEENDWDAVQAVNLDGAFYAARLAYEMHMAPQKSGHILFIGSGSARFGAAGQANYSAAKAALYGLMQSLAREYGEADVRVNAITPGYLETKMNAHLERSPDDHVLNRFNTPQEVARFIVFLDTMPHTSGQVFQLDSRIGREL
ncbi:MAG: SDR family NAD(P)-dependent oxidoreductase [Chthoniobacterales bacterium]